MKIIESFSVWRDKSDAEINYNDNTSVSTTYSDLMLELEVLNQELSDFELVMDEPFGVDELYTYKAKQVD